MQAVFTFLKTKSTKYFVAFFMLLLSLTFIPVQSVKAESNLKVSYNLHFQNQGWSATASDNSYLHNYGRHPNGFKASLSGQDSNMSGTVNYQVNLSGSGWLNMSENGQETGDGSSSMPLEAIRVSLNGDLANNYDIYTKVLVEDKWTDWVKNGETAGTEGVGKHIDGVRISVTAKDAGQPAHVDEPSLSMGRALDPNRPMIALTYDDGPGGGLTHRIIAALDKVGGKGTFFVIGNSIGGNEALLQTMVANGHEIGNHTYHHVAINKQSESARAGAISSTTARIKSITGVTPAVFRPPYGSYNQASLNTVGSQGMASILWSVDTLDWKHRNTQHVVNAVLNNAKDGDIILMHDIHPTTASASEIIIPELARRGYQLVTVSELASYRGGMRAGGSYSSFRR